MLIPLQKVLMKTINHQTYILACFFVLGLFSKGYTQIISEPENPEFYIPVTVNASFFGIKDEVQIGANINNFGFNYNFSGQLKNKILVLSYQQTNGTTNFDPLNFKNNPFSYGLKQDLPAKTNYIEAGFGYNFHLINHSIALLAGVGRQFELPNDRMYLQIDWSDNYRTLNSGVSLRGNYTNSSGEKLVVLEPVIQGSFRVWKLRILNQFGYSIPIKKGYTNMEPILTLGIKYVVNN